MSAPVPFDEHAETALVASLLVDPSRVPDALAIVSPSDLYRPRLRDIYAACEELHRSGSRLDLVTISDALRHAGVSSADLGALMAEATGVWRPEHAQIVLRMAVARRVLAAASQIAADAASGTLPPDELLDAAQSHLGRIEVPPAADARTANVRTFAQFVAETDATPEPWVIPGLMRRGWRCILVAGEGSGKTVLMRTLAGATAAGVHPLEHNKIPPQVVLVIDLENPKDAIAETLSRIEREMAAVGYDDTHAWIEARPGGMDIRSRAGRLDLEALIGTIRPDLVCMGPVYKMYRASARESDELAAGEAMAVLDDLRTRYGFALVLEHHAPKGSMAGRDLLPHGTALWLRWPELGLKLARRDNGDLEVGRWRVDRVKCKWPAVIARCQSWPFRGVYDRRAAA